MRYFCAFIAYIPCLMPRFRDTRLPSGVTRCCINRLSDARQTPDMLMALATIVGTCMAEPSAVGPLGVAIMNLDLLTAKAWTMVDSDDRSTNPCIRPKDVMPGWPSLTACPPSRPMIASASSRNVSGFMSRPSLGIQCPHVFSRKMHGAKPAIGFRAQIGESRAEFRVQPIRDHQASRVIVRGQPNVANHRWMNNEVEPVVTPARSVHPRFALRPRYAVYRLVGDDKFVDVGVDRVDIVLERPVQLALERQVSFGKLLLDRCRKDVADNEMSKGLGTDARIDAEPLRKRPSASVVGEFGCRLDLIGVNRIGNACTVPRTRVDRRQRRLRLPNVRVEPQRPLQRRNRRRQPIAHNHGAAIAQQRERNQTRIESAGERAEEMRPRIGPIFSRHQAQAQTVVAVEVEGPRLEKATGERFGFVPAFVRHENVRELAQRP